jgi:hypothetical protein
VHHDGSNVVLELLASEFEFFFGSVGLLVFSHVLHELGVLSGEGLVEFGGSAEVVDGKDGSAGSNTSDGE